MSRYLSMTERLLVSVFGIFLALLVPTGWAAGEATLVRDIQTGLPGSDPRQLANVNGTLFFAADDGVVG